MGREESPSTKKEKCIGKYGWGRVGPFDNRGKGKRVRREWKRK